MAWFKKQKGSEPEVPKRSKVAEGMWLKCNHCREIVYRKEVERNSKVCPKCDYHSDHLAAVSTVLAERPSWRASGLVGLSWGLGHTAMLLLVGAIVLFLRVPIPQPVAEVAECVVGLMLVALGGLLGMKLL